MNSEASSTPAQPAGDGPSGPVPSPPPIALSDHELLRLIGRGAYGEVWLALSSMGTYRAVKIVYRRSFTDQRPFERELSGIRRFEPISRSHEGFVDILQVGIKEKSGYFYYVMELGDDVVRGQDIDPRNYAPKTLAKSIAVEGRLSVRDSLELGMALSLAVAELHKNGLVHRDIKPSNIIFVNGVPKLADIGLVAGFDEARSYVGTEGFIPPEGPGSPQADVFGLGKVLYEACSGKDRHDYPELPTRLDTFADHALFLELNEVLIQACHTDLGKRYTSAWEMHADLLVVANGKSLKRLKLLERRWARLKRMAVTSIFTGLALAVAGYGIYRNHEVTAELRQRQVISNLESGNRALDSGNYIGGLAYFAQAVRLDNGDARFMREDRLRFGSTRAQSAKLVQMFFQRTNISAVGFSPDGRKVLAVETHGKAQVFDVETGNAVSPRFGQEEELTLGCFSPDGNLVATTSDDNTVCVWRVADGQRLLRREHSNSVSSVRFSPDGSRLVTGCADGLARVWSFPKGDLLKVLPKHTRRVKLAAYSPDGKRIVTASNDSTAIVWDADSGQPMVQLIGHEHWVTYAAFSPDGQLIATASVDHTVRIWDATTGLQILPVLEHNAMVTSVEFSPDGRYILAAVADRTVRLWDVKTHQPVKLNHVLPQSDIVFQAEFNNDGSRIVTGCKDGTVRVFDLAGAAVAPEPRQAIFSEDRSSFLTITDGRIQVFDTRSGHAVSPLIDAHAEGAELNENGRFIVALTPQPSAGAVRPTLRVLDARTGNQVGPPILLADGRFDPLLATRHMLNHTVLSQDGRRLLAFDTNFVQTWDAFTGMALTCREAGTGTINSAVWNRSADLVASWGGPVVDVWNGTNGRDLFTPIRHGFPVVHVEFSPSDKYFLASGYDSLFTKCDVQLRESRTGRAVGKPMVHSLGVSCARFSADERYVATAGHDFAAIIWKAGTGQRVMPGAMHSGVVRAVSFSSDGQWFVTAGSDMNARLWSAATGDPLTPWLIHGERLVDARFLSDPCRVVTTGESGRAWLWELPVDNRPLEDMIKLARLLGGDTVTPWGQIDLRETNALQSIWRELRVKYPKDFVVSAKDAASWHEARADEFEKERDWAAATFHLRRLLAVRPRDPALATRLDAASRHMQIAGVIHGSNPGDGGK